MVERLAGRWRAKWALDDKFMSRLAKVERDGRRLMLGQPQTYMNQSGEAVGKLTKYFRIPLERLLAVVDDADLPLELPSARALRPHESPEAPARARK